MSFLKKLFGGGGSKSDEAASFTHDDFTVTPTPIKEGGEFRVCAEISKEIDGEVQTHKLIRADLCSSKEEAIRLSSFKAKQLIDFEGERLFKAGGGW